MKNIRCFIILHGGGEDERGWATQGKTDLILDNLIAEKKARPMLVVMAGWKYGNVAAWQVLTKMYLRSFENELKQSVIPFVEKNYRAETDANNRALAGFINGWFTNIIYRNKKSQHMFAYLGVFSSGMVC